MLILLVLGGADAWAADDSGPLPRYAVGHVWPLADSPYELVRIEEGQYVFEAPDGEIRLTRTLGFVSVRRAGEYLRLTAPVELKWPLKPGDWGAVRTDWQASRPPENHWGRNRWAISGVRLTWSVEGWDTLALGAKTVRALRIVYQMIAATIATREEIQWELTLWYAPEVGSLVRGTERAFRIVDFELAPSADLATLRRSAHVPEPPLAPPKDLDMRRRHREAAPDAACAGRRCRAD